MSVNFDNSKPIYVQLMDYFFQKLCSSSLKPGEKLPSVRETAIEVGVNPNTVQRAYSEMERINIVVAKRGQGSFVTEDKAIIDQLRRDISEQYVDKFVTHMKNNGFTEEETMEQVKKAFRN